MAHNVLMRRWRFLSVLLSCVAFLVAGMPIASGIGASSNPPTTECKAVSAGASCLACGGSCTWASAECATTCINSGPTLPVLSLEVKAPAATRTEQAWLSTLRGLSLRPDPFPPRA